MENIPYFISVEEALTICNTTPPNHSVEQVPLDQAHGRVLAQTIISTVNDPPFDNSSMDGFACQLEPNATYPLSLTIKGTQAATGDHIVPSVAAGEAVRIMTGAPMPPGANAILPIERCDVVSEEEVRLLEPPKPHFVRKEGENLKKGESSLLKGTYLTPANVGLCATMGHAQLPVFRRLRIAVISTGDELVPPGEPLNHGEIFESNSYGLAGLVMWAGHEPVRLSSVSDSLDDLRATLNEAAKTCDVLLTSGGVSMGEFDYVRRLMEEEGDVHFWRMKIRPGSPPLFGTWAQTPLFGLPGNPVSSHVVFRMLVAPYLRASMGTDGPQEWRIRAQLCDAVKSTKDCLTLRRVTLVSTEQGMMAYQPKHQGSGNLDSLATAHGLTLLKPGQSGEKGTWIDVLVL